MLLLQRTVWQRWHLGPPETIVSLMQMSFTTIQTISGMESLAYKHHRRVANIHQRRAVIYNMTKVGRGKTHTHTCANHIEKSAAQTLETQCHCHKHFLKNAVFYTEDGMQKNVTKILSLTKTPKSSQNTDTPKLCTKQTVIQLIQWGENLMWNIHIHELSFPRFL